MKRAEFLKQLNQGQPRQLQRNVAVDISELAEDARKFRATISSDSPVDTLFGREILSHEKGAVSYRGLDRLPLLVNHDQRSLPIGYVENFKIDGGRQQADIVFSEGARADDVLSLWRQGVPIGLSIGYMADFRNADFEDETETVTFRQWVLNEVSAVSVPADATAGLGRSAPTSTTGDDDMDPKDGGPGGTGTVLNFDGAVAQGRSEGAKAERERIEGIRGVFALEQVPDNPFMNQLEQRAVAESWTVDAVRAEVLANLGRETAPASPTMRSTADVAMTAGEDASERFLTAASAVLLVRAQLADDNERKIAAESGMRGIALADLARQYLRSVNHPGAEVWDREKMIGYAFTHKVDAFRAFEGHTTSDFTSLLANTASKALLRGWEEQPESWRAVARVGSLPDFKVADRANLGAAETLEAISENGEIKSGTAGDFKETIQLIEYAKKFSLGRRAIINDDLNAFTRIPRNMGRAASRTVGNVFYDLLKSNSRVGPTLNQDSKALFHADHNNYVTAGGAPSVTTFNTAFASMAKQTAYGQTDAYLNVVPATVLIPPDLRSTTRQLVESEKDPSTGTDTMTNNPFRNSVRVVEEARLSDVAAGWYLAADPEMHDVAEIAFLNGIDTPYLREEQAWDTRGVSWVAGIDAGVAMLDFRGWYYNDGTP